MIPLGKEEQAFLIQWLANVLCHELNEDQFKQYENGTFEPLFQLLAEQGFSEQIQGIKQALESLKGEEFAYLELAADFTEAFLLDGESSALPYASVYLTEETEPAHFAFMDSTLEKFTLQLNKAVKEPSDHLGVYLEILYQFILHSDIAEQTQFVQGYMLPWLRLFYAKLQRIPTKTQFYQSVVKLLIDILSV